MENDTECLLMIVIVQSQDMDEAQSNLEKLDIAITRLPSVGGFLGLRNATFLIGLQSAKKQQVLDALHQTCRQRVEYIAVPLESAPLPLPTPTAVTVGGATIFSINVEHLEVL